MAYNLTQYQIDLIDKKLPPQFAVLKDRYPVSVFNAANHWDKPKFPQGYVPKQIAIYYDETPTCPSISWENGKLRYVRIEEIPVDPDVTLVRVEALWTYIRVQGQVILDRTEGVQFPPELTHHELMLRQILHSMSSGNFKEF